MERERIPERTRLRRSIERLKQKDRDLERRLARQEKYWRWIWGVLTALATGAAYKAGELLMAVLGATP